MDRELVEQVTKIVLERLNEMKRESGHFSKEGAVKVWPHETPLPDPIILKCTEFRTPVNNEIIKLVPYTE